MIFGYLCDYFGILETNEYIVYKVKLDFGLVSHDLLFTFSI